MPGKYDDIDVSATKDDAFMHLEDAEQSLEATLKAMKYINCNEGKTYDLADTKKALKKVQEAKAQL